MSIRYENIVPWGRSYNEYVKMFMLSPYDLKKRIVGCGDGPAAFNSVGTANGTSIVSVDPLYKFSKQLIQNRIDDTFEEVLKQTKANMDKFVWTEFGNTEQLGVVRMHAMKQFLDDYHDGKEMGRYIEGELPSLPFKDGAFDLALSSHFLFLYSALLDLDFHVKAITEMLRIANEVRIFPIVDLNAGTSPHLNGIMQQFKGASVIETSYEFQRGGNKMLIIKNPMV